jgi:serine protease inhibitor
LPEIEQKLSKATLDGWLDNLRTRNVNVHLPRLKFDTFYQLPDALKKLGMKHAFINPLDADGADFRGMFEPEGSDELFYISQVLHKACVEVDEKGTEAAAATAVLVDTGAIDISTVPFAPTFRADRPFICIIRERPTNTILFIGRVMEPE